jgi:hypothetical protein
MFYDWAHMVNVRVKSVSFVPAKSVISVESSIEEFTLDLDEAEFGEADLSMSRHYWRRSSDSEAS